jgi:hypothetical protein
VTTCRHCWRERMWRFPSSQRSQSTRTNCQMCIDPGGALAPWQMRLDGLISHSLSQLSLPFLSPTWCHLCSTTYLVLIHSPKKLHSWESKQNWRNFGLVPTLCLTVWPFMSQRTFLDSSIKCEESEKSLSHLPLIARFLIHDTFDIETW